MASHVRMLSCISKRKVLNGMIQPMRCIHSSQELLAGQRRRLQLGQAGNKTKYGPLTDLPDYTYLDGRPTPLTTGQKKRREERIEMAKRVVELVKEVQFAEENHKNRTQQKENERQERLLRTLKPKVKS